MIDVINKISIYDTEFNSSTTSYMAHTGQTVGPEDVYFSLNMIIHGIGRVADWDSAYLFSTELIYNPNSLGGHNFWLSNKNWLIDLKNIFLGHNKICLMTTPYGLKMGGGEINLLNYIKYFILYRKCIIYLCITDDYDTIKNTIKNVIGSEFLDFIIIYNYEISNKFIKKVDYHFDMCNSKIGAINACSSNLKNNIYHCQFPFDKEDLIINSMIINNYKNIVLNSDFTKDFYIKYTNEYLTDQKISIIYPCCFNKVNNNIYEKEDKSFIMIGRIFNYHPNANNKNFDIALKYFEEISKSNDNFIIHIIGTVYSKEILNKLQSFKIKNLYFHLAASENEKIEILKKTKYIINMVGINRDKENECYAYEHFGISIIEGINYGCIPISINGGYPGYYINESNGILFNNENDFKNIVNDIIINNKQYNYNRDFYLNFLKNFSFTFFSKTIDNIIN